MPTWPVKQAADVLAPVLCHLCNTSLQNGVTLREAYARLSFMLTDFQLELHNAACETYVAALHLVTHAEDNELFPVRRSATFGITRQWLHVSSVYTDITEAVKPRQITTLALLLLNAAGDTADQSICYRGGATSRVRHMAGLGGVYPVAGKSLSSVTLGRVRLMMTAAYRKVLFWDRLNSSHTLKTWLMFFNVTQSNITCTLTTRACPGCRKCSSATARLHSRHQQLVLVASIASERHEDGDHLTVWQPIKPWNAVTRRSMPHSWHWRHQARRLDSRPRRPVEQRADIEQACH